MDKKKKREIFVRVRDHLLKQRERSVGLYGLCAYRGALGHKCAIGCLIPDHAYTPEMEGFSIHGLLENHPSVAPYLGLDASPYPKDVGFLSNLQCIHDDLSPDIWEQNLSELGERYGLIEDGAAE